MPQDPDSALGDLAVAQGLITRTELEACLEARGLSGGTRPLAEILLEMQLVTRDQLVRLQKLQAPAAPAGPVAPESDLFGRLAISRGYASAEQVEDALAEQARLADAGQDLKLGQIMVRKRYLSPPQFIEVLKLQEQVEQGAPAGPRTAPTMPASPPKPAPAPAADSSASDQTIRRPGLDEEIRGTSRKTAAGKSSSRNLRPGSRGDATFGRYQLLGKIGRGRLGLVYKALDVPLNRTVALKMIKAGEAPPETVQRFLRQAKIAARLNHPGIITIHEVGTIDDASYFTMEFIEGFTFEQVAADRESDRRRALEVLEKAARALDYAHSSGVVHGCLTPAQVLVDKQGQPHLTDFGMADPVDVLGAGQGAYLAPELLEGTSGADARSDIYALGALLFEALAGCRPFDATEPDALRDQVSAGPVTTPRREDPKVPADLEKACLRALDADPSARFESAAELADEIKRHVKGPGGTRRSGTFGGAIARRKGLLVAVLLLLAVGLGGAWTWKSWSEKNRIETERRLARERREKAEPHYVGAKAAAERFARDLRTLSVVELGPAGESVLRRIGECLEADPVYPEAEALKARVLAASGRWTEAAVAAGKALAAHRDAPPLVFEVGRLRWRESVLLSGAPLAVAGPAGEILSFPGPGPAAESARAEALAKFRSYLQAAAPADDRAGDAEERLYARAAIALADQRPEEALDLATDLQRSPGTLRDDGPLLKSLAYAAMKQRGEDALREFDQAARLRSPLAARGPVNGITPFTVPELERAAELLAREESPGAGIRGGIVKLLLGDVPGARKAFGQAGSADGSERLAWLEIGASDPGAAAPHVASLAAAEPDSPRTALLKLALAHAKHLATGVGAAELAAGAEELLKKQPRHPVALLYHGRSLLARGLPTDGDDALKSASEALRILVAYPHAYELRAAAKIPLKDFLGVTEDLRKCREIWPQFPPAYRTAALQQLVDRRFDLARKEAEGGLRVRPADPGLHLLLARVLFEMQDSAAAEAEIKQVIALQPANPEPQLFRVQILLRGNREEALREIDRIIRDFPGEYQGWFYRAQIRAQARDLVGARQDLDQAMKVAPAAAQANLRRFHEEVARRAGPEWLQKIREAQGLIGRAADTSLYPKIHELFGEGLRDLEKNPPGELSRELAGEVMLAHYNYACTWSVLSAAAGAKREEFCVQAVKHLEEALKRGFARNPSGPHRGYEKAHDGYEHIQHDTDFDAVRQRPDFKALMEKYSKEREEF